MASMAELDGNMEMDKNLYNRALKGMYAMAVATFIPVTFIRAPYGRHSRAGWGPSVSPRLAWFLMESPTLWMSALLFPLGRMSSNPTSLILLMVFLAHYIHRCCIYPLRIRPGSKPYPISIAAMAFFFNTYNTYLQIRWISHYGDYTAGWLRSPTFIVGLLVFIMGMIINVWADSVLLSLRRGSEGYKIPRGGLFEYVSCPNYFGEMVEWIGWAVMTWSFAGLSFFLYTAANLGPRAAAHHDWVHVSISKTKGHTHTLFNVYHFSASWAVVWHKRLKSLLLQETRYFVTMISST